MKTNNLSEFVLRLPASQFSPLGKVGNKAGSPKIFDSWSICEFPLRKTFPSTSLFYRNHTSSCSEFGQHSTVSCPRTWLMNVSEKSHQEASLETDKRPVPKSKTRCLFWGHWWRQDSHPVQQCPGVWAAPQWLNGVFFCLFVWFCSFCSHLSFKSSGLPCSLPWPVWVYYRCLQMYLLRWVWTPDTIHKI